MPPDHNTGTDTSSQHVSKSWMPPLTRRAFLRTSAACIAGLASTVYLQKAMAAPLLPLQTPGFHAATSLDKAYVFLDKMMDLYYQDQTLRLVQSYVPTQKLNLGDEAFTYDNAATVIAYLQRGQSDDLRRATLLGDSLVYGQNHDPDYNDGRLRNSYHADPYVLPNGNANYEQGGSFTGNMAWPGLALAHLYHQTNTQSYLTGAAQLGNWIQTNTNDSHGAGGYTGGVDSNNLKIPWKSTEHNLDAYTLFTFLAQLTNDNTWLQYAQHALTFIQAMWNSQSGFFWTGTLDDGATINMSVVPEDMQSWSYLALRDPTYAASLDWAKANLAAHDKQFSGVSFSNADTSGVWFEGTGHMASALLARKAPGDVKTAKTYLKNIHLAQAQAPNTDHKGIVAASHDGLNTGFGDQYFAALHIGATSWYCIAQQQGNPFQL